MGGSLGRREATGRGVMITTREAAKHLGLDIKNATVAVQGFGNVGSVSAQLLSRLGAKIVAVTDWKGGVYNAKGLDVDKLIKWAAEKKTVAGFPDGETLAGDKIFGMDVDILVPAALENQITMDNAPKIQREDRGRGRQRPDHPGRPPAPARARRVRDPRHPRERRRRHDVIFRVGAGPLRVLLERKGSQRAARTEDGRGVPRRS